jgi:hypothetical protein
MQSPILRVDLRLVAAPYNFVTNISKRGVEPVTYVTGRNDLAPKAPTESGSSNMASTVANEPLVGEHHDRHYRHR